MKKSNFVWNRLLSLAGVILGASLGTFLVACTDYEGIYEERYGYMEDESRVSSSSDLYAVFRSSSSSYYGYGYSSSSFIYGWYSSSSSYSSYYRSSSSDWDLSSSSSEPEESSSSGDGFKGSYGLMQDTRDGKYYKTVVIGDVTWMAENLMYDTEGSRCSSVYSCDDAGFFYDWKEAQTACPDWWSLPSKEDWEDLMEYARANTNVNDEALGLKASGYWEKSPIFESPDSLENMFGFSAIPANFIRPSDEPAVDNTASFWSSTMANDYVSSISVYIFRFAYLMNIQAVYMTDSDFFAPIRCLRK